MATDHNLDIVVLTEVQSQRVVSFSDGDHASRRIILFPTKDEERGVGFVIKLKRDPADRRRIIDRNAPEFCSVESTNPPTPRVQTLHVKYGNQRIAIIGAYAPTNRAPRAEREEFWGALQYAINQVKTGRYYILGDLNAHIPNVCRQKPANCNGADLQTVIETNTLEVTNFREQRFRRHIWTWRPRVTTAFAGANEYFVHDLALAPMSYRLDIQRIRAVYPLLDRTDHRMVRARLQPRHNKDRLETKRRAQQQQHRRKDPSSAGASMSRRSLLWRG